MDFVVDALITGIGATAVMDLWAIVRRRLFSVPLPNYSMLGRWVAHMVRGTFRHDALGAAAGIPGERWLGWIVHYLTGIVFAAGLLALSGAEWLQRPALGPALLFGIATVAAPFLLMQPGMGMGVAAARTAHPGRARVQSLVTHAVFGAGLYGTAWLAALTQGH